MANASDTKASETAASETGGGRDCIVAAELAANGGHLTEEQREALVARVAARDASFSLTEQRALAAVDEVRAVLSKLDWTCTVLAMVMVFEGRTVGALMMDGASVWTGVALRAGVLTAIVCEGESRVAVFEHTGGTREAKVLPRLFGNRAAKACEREREPGVFDVFDARSLEPLAIGVAEAEARALVRDAWKRGR